MEAKEFKTVADLSSEDLERYRKYLREREDKEEKYLEKRYERAWLVAKDLASLLYGKYHAQKVWLFGSLAYRQRFTKWSDIDIAVEGISDDLYFKAVGEAISIAEDFKVDIVDIEECSQTLKENIEREGIIL